MTTLLPEGLPAAEILRREGFDIGAASHRERRAGHLRIGLVNLMPRKEATELAFARLLAQTGRPVELTLLLPQAYETRSTPREHLDRHYRRWPEVRHESFDAVIVTGAPVETLPFEEVAYWSEMKEILRWARDEVGAGLYICWAAQAALYAFRGIPKTMLEEKAFGVFDQTVLASSALLRGMGPGFPAPVSRHTEVQRKHLEVPGLTVLAASDETGACMVEDRENRAVCIFDHLEYADDTLSLEYERDQRKGLPTRPPHASASGRGWAPYAALFFRNWIDEVAGRRDRQGAEDQAISWLFDTKPEAARERPTVVFQCANRPHLLCEVLTRLAALGINPVSARIRVPGQLLTNVVIELHDAAAGMMDTIAASLLLLSGSRRVIIRMPGGSGGIFRPLADLRRLARAA